MKEILCLKCGKKLGDAIVKNDQFVGLRINSAILYSLSGFCTHCKTPFHFQSAECIKNDQEWLDKFSSEI